jgi:cytochrome c biogenesis protein ResB
MARTTLDISTRDPTSVKAMEMVISMAIGTMVETMETTPNQWLRRISQQSLVTSANKRDTMRISVQKMVLQDLSELDDRRMPQSTRRRHNKV